MRKIKVIFICCNRTAAKNRMELEWWRLPKFIADASSCNINNLTIETPFKIMEFISSYCLDRLRGTSFQDVYVEEAADIDPDILKYIYGRLVK